jgi:hypothetical protein
MLLRCDASPSQERQLGRGGRPLASATPTIVFAPSEAKLAMSASATTSRNAQGLGVPVMLAMDR